MFLVDTNVWLERLLDQVRSGEVGQFLGQVPSHQLSITDFAFHSIALVLARLGKAGALLSFVEDLFVNGEVALVRLQPADSGDVVGAMERFTLDFEDAYQYVAAEKHNLAMVSFDAHFDRTELGREEPATVLAG